MNVVIDSNVLFSALIKDSVKRRIILDYDGFFLFPAFIFEEMEKHKEEILTKSKGSENELEQLLQLLLKKVLIVPNEALATFRSDALKIVQNIDPNDVLFIACALAYPNAMLWSDDKHLKMQNRIKVITTEEMMKLI